MHPALWIAKTGLDVQSMDVSVISNNLANVGTIAFKKGRIVTEDLPYQTILQPGGETSSTTQLSSGLMLGTGVRTVATQKVFTEGSVLQTNNPLDLAINGRGFFEIQMPDGSSAYTRDGQFQLDSTGQVVTSSGYVLQPPVTIPQGALSITVGRDGVVSAQVAGSTAPSSVGTLQLTDFINPSGLHPLGQNLFRQTSASGTPTSAAPGTSGTGALMQGSLETSNVNAVEELVNMIEAQRAYEMNSKSIETVAEMLQFIAQNL